MNDWATCAKSRNCSFLPHNGYSLRLLCRLTSPPVQSITNMLRFLVGFAVVGATSSESTLSAWPQLFLVSMSSAVPSVSLTFLQPLTVPVRFPDSSCVGHSKKQLLVCVHVIPLGQSLGTKPARPINHFRLKTPRVSVWIKFQIQSTQRDFVVAL